MRTPRVAGTQGNRVNEIDRASPPSVIPRIKSEGRLSDQVRGQALGRRPEDDVYKRNCLPLFLYPIALALFPKGLPIAG